MRERAAEMKRANIELYFDSIDGYRALECSGTHGHESTLTGIANQHQIGADGIAE